jgi:hypothetical protein
LPNLASQSRRLRGDSERGRECAAGTGGPDPRSSPKKAKSKVQRAGRSAKKSAAKKKQPPETAETRQVAAMPVETTTIDVIEEPAPGVVAVTEHESVQMTTLISTGVEPKRGEDVSPAGTSP